MLVFDGFCQFLSVLSDSLVLLVRSVGFCRFFEIVSIAVRSVGVIGTVNSKCKRKNLSDCAFLCKVWLDICVCVCVFVCLVSSCLCLANCTTFIFLECAKEISFLSAEKRQLIF